MEPANSARRLLSVDIAYLCKPIAVIFGADAAAIGRGFGLPEAASMNNWAADAKMGA